jgi:hypothetical protein
MAAGPEELIQIVNSSVARVSRTGEIGDQKDLRDWFVDLMPTVCPSGAAKCLAVDPSIRYDQLHGRFILTCQIRDTLFVKSYFLISISTGATYAGGWTNWALNGSLDGAVDTGNWADFPQVGFDDKAVYISTLMFSWSNSSYQYSKMRILTAGPTVLISIRRCGF